MVTFIVNALYHKLTITINFVVWALHFNIIVNDDAVVAAVI